MSSSSNTEQQSLRSPNEWLRASKGRELQFYATDGEVWEWFSELPSEFGPYTAWGTRLVKRAPDGVFSREEFSFPLASWLAQLEGADPNLPDQFFLHPGGLLPNISLAGEELQRANEWGSVNGLVLIQHGASRMGKRLSSRIAIADKIRHRTSGTTLTLKTQSALFSSIERRIKSALRYPSIQVFRDGHEEEDRLEQMTEGARLLAEQGFFDRRAGRPL